MGHQFVMGRDDRRGARARRLPGEDARYRHTYDMLGESALTAPDALRYLEAYRAAIEAVGALGAAGSQPASWPSVSVKLSALHPRYRIRAAATQVLAELGAAARVDSALAARDAGIALTIDAEEAERLEIIAASCSTRLLDRPRSPAGTGFGLAVQAYSEARAGRDRATCSGARTPRDACSTCDSSRAPTGTAKSSAPRSAACRATRSSRASRTPTSPTWPARESCSRAARRVYPQFATHNAHTVGIHHPPREARAVANSNSSACTAWARSSTPKLTDPAGRASPCRVYAPVGSHEDLLPYLVRRLLENGSNTSFVNRIVDESLPVEEVVGDPVADVEARGQWPASAHPAARATFSAPERSNSAGINLRRRQRAATSSPMPAGRRSQRRSVRAPIVARPGTRSGDARACRSPGGPRPRGRRGG